MKSFTANENDVQRRWYVVDAADKPAGRIAVAIADVLRGRHKPTYTPHVDTGDFVVVINADKVKLTGTKEQNKIYRDYSGYTGGLKERNAAMIRDKDPTRIVFQAVKGMLPQNRLSRRIITRLKVYAGPDHPHQAQSVEPLEIQRLA